MSDPPSRNTEKSSIGQTFLRSHFGRIATRLEAEGEEAKSFEHGTNRGQIREAFIREFLASNTSDLTGIGTGEIICPESSPGRLRNQIDVVIYNNRYPKISLDTGIDLFFGETVSSTIEVKSKLTKIHVKKAAKVAKRVKENVKMEPQKFNPTGMVNTPRPYSFIFAYDGPSRIETVLSWMKDVSSEEEYGLERLRNTSSNDRPFFHHFFIDGIFVLGKGYVCLDALPFVSSLKMAETHGLDVTERYIWIHDKRNELPMLWSLISTLSEKYLWNNINLSGYVGKVWFSLSD